MHLKNLYFMKQRCFSSIVGSVLFDLSPHNIVSSVMLAVLTVGWRLPPRSCIV